MCGIFGYVGKKNDAANIVFEGLKLLEYRGYDSWGIAVKAGKKIVIEKHIGKIGNSKIHLPKSSIGIGHTRWATHGGVTMSNAHPHFDCSKQVAVLHNGIIENFSQIKNELLASGHTFASETDTEVAAHLIEDYLKMYIFAEAFRLAFNRLEGMNAVVAVYAPSNEIVAAKTGSPLVVGKTDYALFLASDALGMIKHTRNILFLKDNEMVILGKNIELLSLPKGITSKPVFETVDWQFEDVQKGKYKHFMLKEIHEQPHVIKNIAMNYSDEAKNLATLIRNAFGTFMVGCGTASYAALSGTYLFSRIAKKHVNFSVGSEFKYLEDYLTTKSLVIPISQSGETIDVVEPVDNAKKKGAKIAAVVNVLGSTLYRQSHYKFLIGAGPEKAVVGTKSFIAMIAVLLLTAYACVNKVAQGKKLLLATAKNTEEILKNAFMPKIQPIVARLKNAEHIYVIGRGLSYPAALETSLKIKETSYIHAEGFAGGELKHGVIALIQKGTPCIVIAPNDETYKEIISNAQELKARGGWIIGIGPKTDSVFDDFLPTADVGDATMIPQVVIAQLLAYYLALAKGIDDPDKPRNLAKSVVVK